MSRAAIGLAQLDGRKWQQSHQATIDSILGTGQRTVRSRGSAFFNKDNWTARSFAVAFCEWARLNADHCPDQYDLEQMLRKANQPSVGEYDKGITIASTPDDLPRWLAWALVGGGYHEAWHTKYSRTTPILLREVSSPIAKLWGLVPFDPPNRRRGWAGLTGAVLTWSNIIEDIIIERRGCKDFPGSPQKMEALQDLILQQEGAGTLAESHRSISGAEDVRVIIGAFRDLGLGYETPDQKLAIENYKKLSPKSWEFVTTGPLKPLLDRAIALGSAAGTNGLESLWLAMEVVAAIWMATTPPPPPPAPPKGAGSPPPPGSKPKQQEASAPMGEEEPEPEEDNDDAPPPPPKKTPKESGPKEPKIKLILYKVGDRATIKEGDFAGRTVEIVRAGLPDEKTGEQDLEYALVEDEA